MHDVFNKIRSAAPSDVNVLFCGEHGTGKELMARTLHFNSIRKMNPFITVNHTETMSENLLETQLFGHPQETNSHGKGLIERANHGSLYVNEIGSLPVSTQDKLLQILKNGEFTPVGSNSPIHIEIRIIAATSRDLENAIQQGTFREELFSFINVIEIALPPLRERQEDIPLLSQFFIKKYMDLHSKKIAEIDCEFMDVLEHYSFPDNVRELEHIIERAVILTRDLSLKKTDLPDKLLHPSELKTFKLYTDRSFSQQTLDFERELLLYALDQCNGVQKKAAELLGMKPTTLHEKLKRHQLR
jgi:DNA-binding NtrC family response regulator